MRQCIEADIRYFIVIIVCVLIEYKLCLNNLGFLVKSWGNIFVRKSFLYFIIHVIIFVRNVT